MKKIFLLLMFSILLISLGSAVTFTGKVNTNITLKQSGQDYIPDYCNITSIIFPDETEQLTEPILMVKNGNDFRVSFYFSQLGISKVCGDCADVIGNYDGWCYYEEINSTGEQSGQFIGYFFIILIVFVGILIFGYVIQQESIAILGGLGLMILGVFSFTNGMGMYNNDVTRIASVFIASFGAIVSFVVLLDWFE